MSDSESTPDVTAGNVEGDVNVEQQAPADDSSPEESGGSEGGDTSGDEAQQDTGALQE